MKLKTIQWNIGGGFIRRADDQADGPYGDDGLPYIENLLRSFDPDIVTFQETHSDDRQCQVRTLANALGYEYFFNDTYAVSHIDASQHLGQGVLSRYPISEHSFTLLSNPRVQLTRPDGEVWILHDKGISRCEISLSETLKLDVATLHLFPFRKFGLDPFHASLDRLRDEICTLADPRDHALLLQGDFNIDNSTLVPFLPRLFTTSIRKVVLDLPTTPRGRSYDNVLFAAITHIRSEVLSNTLTDHYPVFSEFEIEG